MKQRRIKRSIIDNNFEEENKDSNQISIRLQETCVQINEKKDWSSVKDHNYTYSQYLTGTSLHLSLMWGVFSNANDINLILMFFPHKSLHGKLVPTSQKLRIQLKYDLQCIAQNKSMT